MRFKRGRRITPAAEWFLDNYHLIEEQIRTARRHLPRGYSRELPLLANGPSAGVPRVYAIALEMISHVDGRIDINGLRTFVASYLRQSSLQLGGRWAIPIMLRLALIENLRRVVMRVTAGRSERERAGDWIERMLDSSAKAPTDVVLVLAEMVKERPALSVAFVSEVATRAQGQSTALALPMTWLEHRLAERGQTIEGVYRQTSQIQAADQVSIGNSIGSLRLLGATEWRDFVEAMSVVDQTLRADPAGVYATMDFMSRDAYRHAVEEIARGSKRAENEVAAAAIALARTLPPRQLAAAPTAADRSGGDAVQSRRLFPHRARPAGCWKSSRACGRRCVARSPRRDAFPLAVYLGSIAVVTALLTGLLLWWYARHGMGTAGLIPLGMLLAFCVSQLAIALVHWRVTAMVRPRLLPRLDFSGGIPAAWRTVVAVPAMLTDAAEIDHLLEELEVRFLANRDENLSFALLSDFRDAPQEHMPEDDALLQQARGGN